MKYLHKIDPLIKLLRADFAPERQLLPVRGEAVPLQLEAVLEPDRAGGAEVAAVVELADEVVADQQVLAREQLQADFAF